MISTRWSSARSVGGFRWEGTRNARRTFYAFMPTWDYWDLRAAGRCPDSYSSAIHSRQPEASWPRRIKLAEVNYLVPCFITHGDWKDAWSNE